MSETLMDVVFEIVGGDGHDGLKNGAPSVYWLRSLVQRLSARGVLVGEHAATRLAPSAAAIEAALDDMAGALQRYANLGDFAKVKDGVRSGLVAAYAVDFGATEEATPSQGHPEET